MSNDGSGYRRGSYDVEATPAEAYDAGGAFYNDAGIAYRAAGDTPELHRLSMGDQEDGPALATDFTAMTNDLRRAIGGLTILPGSSAAADQAQMQTLRPPQPGGLPDGAAHLAGAGEPDGNSSTSSLRPIPVGSKAGAAEGRNGEAGAAEQGRHSGATTVPDELILDGNLDILGRLGEGASGEVKKARHRPTGLLMAKKVSPEIGR